jgi:hypothetical protein
MEQHQDECKTMGTNGKAYAQKYFMRENIAKDWISAMAAMQK